MTLTTIGFLATFFYLITWGLIAFNIKKPDALLSVKRSSSITWVLAIILHGCFLYLPLFSEGLRLDLISAGSQVLWLTSLILFITTCTRRIEILALFVLPLTVLLLLLEILTPDSGKFVNINGTLGSHILLSLLGYSTLFLATLQALLVSLQSKHLHNHQPGGLIRSLPALQDMENLLFRLIFTGVILLSAGLLTGFLFLDDLFGKQVLHKTVLSLIAWAVYTTLLIGHWKQGWRGRKAVTWTIVAFVLLMLAFFGSKFVQEILLSR
ncbi:MAG: cytochrome c biogenesis protein CcsA [Thiotrichaceae bacterium]